MPVQETKITLPDLFHRFFHSEKTGGLLLVACTVVSIIVTNSSWGQGYSGFWTQQVFGNELSHWINDGLMAIFFLLIGLELEREIYIGELSTVKTALFPAIAALGGMLVPAGIYFALNAGKPTQSGIGIPMATDIAFAIGILSLLKIFLTALAVIDDLGAVLVIALFYSKGISFLNLGASFGIFGVLLLIRRLGVRNLIPYILGGILMWYFMLNSGVHAAIAGILLAFAIPFRTGGIKSPSYLLQNYLHKPVAFFILPLFALANTCIHIDFSNPGLSDSANVTGISLGLIVGKPIGIILFCFLSVLLGICVLPSDIKWKHLFGVAILGGIGFTMSFFITLLAFENPNFIETSKIAILFSSLAAGIIGLIYLRLVLPKNEIDSV